MDYPYHFPGGPSQEAEPTHQPHGEPSDQPAIQAANETFEEYVEPPMKWDDLFLPRANGMRTTCRLMTSTLPSKSS